MAKRNAVQTAIQSEEKLIHISSRHSLFDLKLNEVWQYRELIVLFTRRSFQVRYKQTILGPLWLWLNPLLHSVLQLILFGNIAKLSTDGVPRLLFYLTGNAVWSYFSGRVSSNASTFTGNAGLFGKVYFPRLVMPISDILSGMVQFLIQLPMIVVLYIYFVVQGQVVPNGMLLILLPFVFLMLGMMGMGIGIIVSSLTTKYRDLAVLVDFALSLWMYITPVVYPLGTVDGRLRVLLSVNPVTAPVELLRYILFGKGTILKGGLCYSLICTGIVLLVGEVIFNKVERTFIDTV